jgi:hypothetical protein
MKTIERPGVNKKWLKCWKADRRNGNGWRDEYDSLTTQELEHYAQHGVSQTRLLTKPLDRVNPPYRIWEEGNLGRSLSMYGALRLFELEMKGMAGEPFDSALAVRAFAAIRIQQMIEPYSSHMKPMRLGGGAGVQMDLTFVPFTALGVVIGCKSEVFKLARLQIVAYRKGRYRYRVFYPIFHFILRILADYLEEPQITLIGEPLTEPIFNALFDLWREPDAGALVDVCLAACDFHTQRCAVEKDGDWHEFTSWLWSRTPIEILLLFKLRQLIGLPNPQLDHPLMNTPLGKLPEKEVTCEPDDLIRRVRERMMQDGFDEEEIAGYYKD